jgi:phage terminase small subunit
VVTLDEHKLTEKQRRFVDFYVTDPNATKAAVDAGYSRRTAKQVGAENLSKPYLRTAIDARLKELESQRIADAREVLQFLTSTMRGEEQEEIAAFCSDIFRFVKDTKQVDMRTRVRAATLLAKRFGLLDAGAEQSDGKLDTLLAGLEGDSNE